jgi:hypothetical protein
MLGEVCNEILVVIKNRRVRTAPATKKAVFNQDRSALVKNLFNRGELFRRRNLLAIARPLIGFSSTPWLEF